MKQRGRRKLDCLVNGQSSVRIKNRIHLEGRGPEDGSPLLHVRGYGFSLLLYNLASSTVAEGDFF